MNLISYHFVRICEEEKKYHVKWEIYAVGQETKNRYPIWVNRRM